MNKILQREIITISANFLAGTKNRHSSDSVLVANSNKPKYKKDKEGTANLIYI